MDTLKGKVAHRVARLIKDTNWNNIEPSVVDRPNEATYVTDLETMISMHTHYGPRYFVVKVKEQY